MFQLDFQSINAMTLLATAEQHESKQAREKTTHNGTHKHHDIEQCDTDSVQVLFGLTFRSKNNMIVCLYTTFDRK